MPGVFWGGFSKKIRGKRLGGVFLWNGPSEILLKSLLLDSDRDAWKITGEWFSYAGKLKKISSELVPGLGWVWLGFKVSG